MSHGDNAIVCFSELDRWPHLPKQQAGEISVARKQQQAIQQQSI